MTLWQNMNYSSSNEYTKEPLENATHNGGCEESVGLMIIGSEEKQYEYYDKLWNN